MKLALPFFLFFFARAIYAQQKLPDFSSIDKRVKTIHANSPDTLSKALTSVYTTDLEKVRCIFKWITENIAYDTRNYKDPFESYYSTDRDTSKRENIQESDSLYHLGKVPVWDDSLTHLILREKMAICSGYSKLFKLLCFYSNIKSEVIEGYTKYWCDIMNTTMNTAHAWNAVLIDSNWYLLDVTWASGSLNAYNFFIKDYDDYYFLTPPASFFFTHCPYESKWTLISSLPGIEEFVNAPFVTGRLGKLNIISFNPASADIIGNLGTNISFSIETGNRKKKIELELSSWSSFNKTVIKPVCRINGKKLSFNYKPLSSKIDRVDIYFNDEKILSYNLRIEKTKSRINKSITL